MLDSEPRNNYKKLVDSRMPDELVVEYQVKKPVITDVYNHAGIVAIDFEGGGFIGVTNNRVAANNLSDVRVSYKGKVVAEISQIEQSGTGSMTITASDGSHIHGVKQSIK